MTPPGSGGRDSAARAGARGGRHAPGRGARQAGVRPSGGFPRRSAEVTPCWPWLGSLIDRIPVRFSRTCWIESRSIRTSHPSGSRRAPQPEPRAPSPPRRRHQKRDRCEGVSRQMSQISWFLADMSASPTPRWLTPSSRNEQRAGAGAGPIRATSSESQPLLLAPAPARLNRRLARDRTLLPRA